MPFEKSDLEFDALSFHVEELKGSLEYSLREHKDLPKLERAHKTLQEIHESENPKDTSDEIIAKLLEDLESNEMETLAKRKSIAARKLLWINVDNVSKMCKRALKKLN